MAAVHHFDKAVRQLHVQNRNLRPSVDEDGERGCGSRQSPLFQCVEQLLCCEHIFWNMLDGLPTAGCPISYFCREYWHTAASHAQVAIDRYIASIKSDSAAVPPIFRKQVQVACILESVSLGVLSYYSNNAKDLISTVGKRLYQLIECVYENCLTILDWVYTRWSSGYGTAAYGDTLDPRPECINLDLLVRINRCRKIRRGGHAAALRQQNDDLINLVRDLVRIARAKFPPHPVDRKARRDVDGAKFNDMAVDVLTVVADIISKTPMEKRKVAVARSQITSSLKFRPSEMDEVSWDYSDTFDANEDTSTPEFVLQVIYFEPMPPMLPLLDRCGTEFVTLIPRIAADTYTLVLDLDETLVHFFGTEGPGHYEQRPGCRDFLQRMHSLGFEIIVFTAATQDYADWVMNEIDPERLVQYRLYRQNALPFGPVYVKDLRRLGRDLDRTIIIDNVAENFMLQPENGICIAPWYEDREDRVLETLTPVLEELIITKETVPRILERYKNDIHRLAGHPDIPEAIAPAATSPPERRPRRVARARSGANRGEDTTNGASPAGENKVGRMRWNEQELEQEPHLCQEQEQEHDSVLRSKIMDTPAEPYMDVTVLAFAQWVSELRQRQQTAQHVVQSEMSLIRNSIATNHQDLTDFKRHGAQIQVHMQKEISEIQTSLASVFQQINTAMKNSAYSDQELKQKIHILDEQVTRNETSFTQIADAVHQSQTKLRAGVEEMLAEGEKMREELVAITRYSDQMDHSAAEKFESIAHHIERLHQDQELHLGRNKEHVEALLEDATTMDACLRTLIRDASIPLASALSDKQTVKVRPPNACSERQVRSDGPPNVQQRWTAGASPPQRPTLLNLMPIGGMQPRLGGFR